MNERTTAAGIAPGNFDWEAFLRQQSIPSAIRVEVEHRERQEDLAELRWLLDGVRGELALYREAFPDSRFERELEAAYARQADALEQRVLHYERQIETCGLNAFLTVKYDIRTLYKQLGATIAASDWQSPCKRLASPRAESPDESGFVQEEQGTYMRSYGSETVKAYESASMQALYPMSCEARRRSAGFLTTSGMKALELALAAYRSFTREALPCYYQRGFYGEGIELAQLLLNGPMELGAAELCRKVEANEPIGCLLVDPGKCWPVSPAIDLARLFDGLSRHRQDRPLYVIVDRTLTGIANPLFARYADRLPSHVVLISVESGIKYMQYGLELANVGYVVAVDRRLEGAAHRESWVTLLSLLDAGADPVTVRQLPVPDMRRLTARLSRLNRNAHWLDAFLALMVRQGRVASYERSVDPCPAYMLDGRPWIGSVFYIRLPGNRSEGEYQAWIDSFVAAAPEERHFVSGGSFGFDTFRMNAVSDKTGRDNALRVSVGRDPLGQLLLKLSCLYAALPG